MASTGTDLLELLPDDGVQITDAASHQATFGELRTFNQLTRRDGTSRVPPLALGLVRVFDPVSATTFHGFLEPSDDATLRIIDLADARSADQPAAKAAGNPALDRLMELVQAGQSADVVDFLDEQINRRTDDLKLLSRLRDAFTTAVQAAVDAVQSTRISVLEDKTEPVTEGLIGAVIVTFVFTVFPAEALAAQTVSWLGALLGRVAGGAAGAQSAARMAAARRSVAALEREVDAAIRAKGQAYSAERAIEAVRKANDARQALAKLAAKAAAVPPADEAVGLFVGAAAGRPPDAAHPLAGVAKFVKDTAAGQLGNKTTNVQNALQRGDTPDVDAGKDTAKPPQVPMDVALKQEVTAAFIDFVALAQDILDALKKLRAYSQGHTPPDAAIVSLAEILVPTDADAVQIAGKSLREFQEDLADVGPSVLMKDLEEVFEFAIWDLLYGNRVLREQTPFERLAGPTVIASAMGIPSPMPPPIGPFARVTDEKFEDQLAAIKARFPIFADSTTDAVARVLFDLFQQLVNGPDGGGAATGGGSNRPELGVDWNRFAQPDVVFASIRGGFAIATATLASAPP